MARGKKKETLTPEERLQAALVPESEQPYPVPGNWCWIHLVDSFYNCTDSKKKVPQKEYIQDGRIAIVDQGQDLVGGYTNDSEMAFSGHLPVIIFGDHTRCIKYIDFPFVQGADGVKVLKPKQFYDTKAFYYAFQNITIPNMGYRRHFPLFDQYAIPLPPLSEQRRIVDRIESLFSKLDEAKQKAQDALDSFETRKAAILHKAFTGEFTAQWRKEHGVRIGSWTSYPLKDVTQIGSGGTPSRKNYQYYLGNILWVKTGEIYWNCIYDSEEKITEEAIANSSAKLYPAGTVLVAMYGQGLTRGRAAILGVPAATNQAVCALQPCDGLKKRYLYYYFMANYWEYREKAVGGNQPNYSATMIGEWIINIPSVLEQTEIVRILDDLLAKEQQAKDAAEKVLEQIDLIKKAILARAFRGELETNDPSEESAVELVKRVIERGE